MEKAPRVTVDRLTNSSNIFHTGRLRFQSGCGFWFGIAWYRPDLKPGPADRSLQQAIHLILDLLADTGMGAERMVGYGHFKWQAVGQKAYPDPQPGRPFVTLSRYHPRAEELPTALRGEAVAYRLASVGGWLQSGQHRAQRRRRLWMVDEGSIVQAAGAGPWGDVQDVRPVYEDPHFPAPPGIERFSHPVWRYGLACPVAFGGAG